MDNDASSPLQEVKGNMEATDGKLEIDSGGMGCKNIEKAMEERRQILRETETKEGVVLLSVQKVEEESTNRFETYGMRVCYLEMHTHPCVQYHLFLYCAHLILKALVCNWWSGDILSTEGIAGALMEIYLVLSLILKCKVNTVTCHQLETEPAFQIHLPSLIISLLLLTNFASYISLMLWKKKSIQENYQLVCWL